MVHLYLTRHGETCENVAQVLQGHLPGELTPKGREQAENLALHLPTDVRFDVLLTSDLQRAIDTAHILNRHLCLPIHPTPLLRERDWGGLTGKRIADVPVPEHFPEDVESVEAMFDRAHRFLQWLNATYDCKNVLAVGHGLFCRCICAALNNQTIRDIPRWQNAELRHLIVASDIYTQKLQQDTEASAD